MEGEAQYVMRVSFCFVIGVSGVTPIHAYNNL